MRVVLAGLLGEVQEVVGGSAQRVDQQMGDAIGSAIAALDRAAFELHAAQSGIRGLGSAA